MSTSVKFGGKIYQLPGTYSRIISGNNNPPRDLDYGKLLIIDNENLDSTTAGYGIMGGAGVSGELSTDKASIYPITNINDFRDFVGGNWWYNAAEALFNPDGKSGGVSQISVIKPSTTTCARMTFVATGTGLIGGANGGTVTILTKDESTESNGDSNETAAHSTLTISNAGATADTLTVKVAGRIVAVATNGSSDNIATMVGKVATNMTALRICTVISQDGTTVHFSAPKGQGSNTTTPTVVVTGTAAGSCTAMSGGVDSTNLYRGYAYTIETGVLDSAKWIMKFWRGSYKGLAADGLAWDEVAEADSTPVLICQSTEFSNMSTLITWMQQSTEFGNYFHLLSTSAAAGSGVVVTADIALIKSYQEAISGSETYNAMDAALDAITDLDYNIILTTSSTANPSTDGDIIKIIDHITNEAKYDKMLVIAGHDSVIATSIGWAQTLDSEKVVLVHGGIKKANRNIAGGFRNFGAFFHAAYYAGRLCGLAPWVPATYKSLNIDGLQVELSDNNKIKADAAGVVVTCWDTDFKRFICLHDVNTLQLNEFVLNNDGTSHLIQVERIKAQLNKELIINSKLDLMSNPDGVTRISLSNGDVAVWTQIYLERKIGSLITEWKNVTATTVGDVIMVEYEAMPNSEIKSIFFTGRLYL